MIIKVPVYFLLETEDGAKIENVDLLKDTISRDLNDYLSGHSLTLTGSFWSGNRLKAKFMNPEEAIEALRTKK